MWITLPHVIISFDTIKTYNPIGGVMVSVLDCSAIDRGFEPQSGQVKTIKLAFDASPQKTHL